MAPEFSGRFAWCLRLTVAVQCVGIAGRYLFSAGESESDVYGLLYFDWDWPEATALAIDNAGTWSALVAGCLVLVGGWRGRRGDGEAPRRSALGLLRGLVDAAALLVVAGWFLTLAIAHTLRGEPYCEWTLLEQAVRYVSPLALLVVGRSGGAWRRAIAIGLLRLAVAATFTGHGYLALQHYGYFVDLLLLSDAQWFGFGLSQGAAEVALTWIGWIDVTVAASVLLTGWRVPAGYAAAWGAITATSRITALGLAAWPETLLRAANCGAPLALLLYAWAKRTTAAETSNAHTATNTADST